MSLVPALLALLFAAWAGTFAGGATLTGAVSGQLAILALVVATGLGRDPLGLGRAGRWLPAAVVVAVAASCWASPVARAGRVGVLLLPAFLLLPSAVERCWREGASRRLGLRALSLCVGAIAAWALIDQGVTGLEKAAQPLGHHGLLSAWLVTLLPLGLVPVREGGRWRGVALVAGGLAVAALVSGRSLAALAALALIALVFLFALPREATRDGPRRRMRWVGLAVLAAALLPVLPRLGRVLAGVDPSLNARLGYLEAGWRGFVERPVLGWGPGSAHWLTSIFRRPIPGLNPPGETVTQLHSLPLQLLFELGLTGGLMGVALGGIFLYRRLVELSRVERGAADRLTLGAALAGLVAGGLTSISNAALDVTALPVAFAVAAGAALAAGKAAPGKATVGEVEAGAWAAARPLAAVYAAVVVIALAAPWRAQLAYERAFKSLSVDPREIARAVELDPRFPLYRAWLTWAGAHGPAGRLVAAEPARQAARDAAGLAPLWLMAGVYGLEAREAWSPAALARACELAPLGAHAPFFLMVAKQGEASAARHGARALVAEPRLAAATFWERRPDLLRAALKEVEAWPGVGDGWKVALLEAVDALPPPAGGVTELEWVWDAEGETLLSLHAFRRRPRTVRFAPIRVRENRLRALSFPAAAGLPSTSGEAFGARGCEAR